MHLVFVEMFLLSSSHHDYNIILNFHLDGISLYPFVSSAFGRLVITLVCTLRGRFNSNNYRIAVIFSHIRIRRCSSVVTDRRLIYYYF